MRNLPLHRDLEALFQSNSFCLSGKAGATPGGARIDEAISARQRVSVSLDLPHSNAGVAGSIVLEIILITRMTFEILCKLC